MVRTSSERVEIIFIYGSQNKCIRKTVAVYNEKHPDKKISLNYVKSLVKKFETTGSVCNKKRLMKPRVVGEMAQLEILGHFSNDPTLSIRKVSKLTNISVGSVHKVLKLNKFFPYKLQFHQQLAEDDYDRRI